MKTIFRFILVILILIVIAVLGAAAFVHFYFTEDRIKTLVVTEGEMALGRKVKTGKVSVGLFKGIEVKSFAVKEMDNKTDFLSAKDIILKYDLFSLLDKKLLITDIIIDEPKIKIIRDRHGRFNYESMLDEKERKPKKGKKTEGPASKAAPLALIIDNIKIDDADISIRDALKEIPDTDAKGDLKLSISMSEDMSSINYKGKLDMESSSKLKGFKVEASLKAGFDPSSIKFKADIKADEQRLSMEGSLNNWAKAPVLAMDVSGDRLYLE